MGDTKRDDRPIEVSIKDERANGRIHHRAFARGLTDDALAETCEWAADKERTP